MKTALLRLLRRAPFFERSREAIESILPGTRKVRADERGVLAHLRARTPPSLTRPLYGESQKRVLFVGMGQVKTVYLETFLRKSFEVAGYRPVALIPRQRTVRNAYRALGEKQLVSLDQFQRLSGPDRLGDDCRFADLSELLSITRDQIRCGKYAASTLMRTTRSGNFDFSNSEIRALAERALQVSLDHVVTANRMLERLRPDAVVFVDRGYSPSGELFDACMSRGIPAYTWNAAHRNNMMMLKRYTSANADVHPSALSALSWQKARTLPWSEQSWAAVRDELVYCYRSGEWYGEVGTQLNKELFERDSLRRKLDLDPNKKTAVIFPHIFWDATFFWGEDLFGDYETWFVEALRAACANDRLNWIIKVHPANLVKDARDGYRGEHSEIQAIRKTVGKLPAHVKLLDAETDISTLSLYALMDYCLTVRGTVGIEAACFGVSVLTAGTGRYDRLGFTRDFDSQRSYLEQLAHLEKLPTMTEQQIELARRYAAGVFLCRPAMLESLTFEYRKNASADLQVGISEQAREDLRKCGDIRSISNWIASEQEDYFSVPEKLSVAGAATNRPSATFGITDK